MSPAIMKIKLALETYSKTQLLIAPTLLLNNNNKKGLPSLQVVGCPWFALGQSTAVPSGSLRNAWLGHQPQSGMLGRLSCPR